MAPARVPLIYVSNETLHLASTLFKLIQGAASFGKPNTRAARIHTIPECQAVLDEFCNELGYKELDTARGYGDGSAEEFLSELDAHGAAIDTKAGPPLDAESLTKKMEETVKALGKHKIRVYFLHAPDTKNPFYDTAATINKFYKDGLFEEFGLSNFDTKQTQEMYDICKEHGFVLPTVHQGGYSIMERGGETELYPLLRNLNMRITAYSPLAGGLLAGSLNSKDDPGPPGGRFDATTRLGKLYRTLHTQGRQFEARELLRQSADKNGLSMQEIALRWLQHHSLLTRSDGVIIGASSVAQLKQNCLDSEKGPLPEDVLKVIEEIHVMLKDDYRTIT